MSEAAVLAAPAAGDRAAVAGRSERATRLLEMALLALGAVFYALHFVHLRADFPNHSPWPDWAKFTDEGWYGSAAIRHYQIGHWNLPGDFNPAAALPVWPLLEMAVFHFTGVSLAAARALTVVVFGFTLLRCYLLLRRWARTQEGAAAGFRRSLAPATAVLLLAASPFFFVFSRLAILEPLLVLLVLKSLMLAQDAGAAGAAAWGGDTGDGSGAGGLQVRAVLWAGVLGLMLPAMVLTKTTGLFLFPAILWMLWAGCAYRLRIFLRAAAVAGVVAATVWGGYMLLFVRPHYFLDYRYLFSANTYTGITAATFWPVVLDTIFGASFLGVTIFWLGVLAVLASLATIASRRFRGDPLTVSLLLWIFFYAAFLAYHDNLSPRYYQVLGVPLTMLIAMQFDRLWWAAMGPGGAKGNAVAGNPADRILLRLVAAACCAAIMFAVVRGAAMTAYFAGHPEYSYLSAANQIRDAVERQRAQDLAEGRPVHPEMVLSISGASLSLMSGLPSICDDFGTMSLPDRIEAYKPGWFASWNDVEDDKMEALTPAYNVIRVGAYPALDDPDRNLLILYRLDWLESPGKAAPRQRATRVPRRLKTRVGGQPTAKQPEH
jgi:4-amino-4-deoxy-L-arabinose transferase-like glycosyltransferase